MCIIFPTHCIGKWRKSVNVKHFDWLAHLRIYNLSANWYPQTGLVYNTNISALHVLMVPFTVYSDTTNLMHKWNRTVFRGFIKGRALGKLTGCERNLAINLPSCFRLLFLLSFIHVRKTKNAWLKNPTDLLHKNLMKPLSIFF